MLASAVPPFVVEIAGRRWRVRPEPAFDLSIAMRFDGAQPVFFGAARASASCLSSGPFIGDVRQGGSCNCSTYTLTPHCNGTHTECVGHITAERIDIRNVPIAPLLPAVVLSVTPQPPTQTEERSEPTPDPADRLITRASLMDAARDWSMQGCEALIVRTLPNGTDKQARNYDVEPAVYFSAEAMRWIVDRGIAHLIVDLPSVDRGNDQGHLHTHRIFWGMPPGGTHAADATRTHATITELAYMDDTVADGHYLLNLQLPPFASDAAPSRPLLYRRTPE